MIWILAGLGLTIIIFTLYCCIRSTTSYDNKIDDIEQEKFIKEWKERMLKK